MPSTVKTSTHIKHYRGTGDGVGTVATPVTRCPLPPFMEYIEYTPFIQDAPYTTTEHMADKSMQVKLD